MARVPRISVTTPTDLLLDITFDPDPALADLIEGALFLCNSTGWIASGEMSDRERLTAFFDSPDDREDARERVESLHSSVSATPRDEPRLDWLERYEQSLVAIEVGECFLVAPDQRLIDAVRTDRIPLIVPQERAFGTGSHPTTAMCLELLERWAAREARGLDIGTGSGILAIGMVRLGVSRVFAFDNDAETLGVVRDNLRRNRLPEIAVSHFIGGVESLGGGRFDVITMNIIPEVILPLLPGVIRLLGPGGRLILSGILQERAGEVHARARELGLRLQEARESAEWWAGSFTPDS